MTDLVLPICVAVAFLYLPGYPLLRGLRISWRMSLGFAPLPSAALYALLGIVYDEAGVPCSWETVFAPVLAVCLAVWAAGRLSSRLAARRRGGHASAARQDLLAPADRPASSAADVAAALLYAAVGCLTWTLVFGMNVQDPSAFSQSYDNVHHLGAVRTFLESGCWSSLHSSLYASSEQAFSPVPEGSFYPSAWHCVAALVASASGCSVAASANAANAAFSAVAYPLATFSFIRYVAPGKPAALFAGALVASAFGVFPWRLLTFGPIFPNLAAFALVPAAAACFVAALEAGRRPMERAAGALLFLVACVAEALLQPNAVFTLAVLLAPYCMWRIAQVALGSRAPKPLRVALAVIGPAAFLALAAALWVALYGSDFMAGVVSFEWEPFATTPEAIGMVATFAFDYIPPQLLLAALTAVGAACSFKRPRCPWIAVALVAMCAIYVVAASTEGPLKQLLSGFWYTDRYRLASCVVIFATPLAALGLALPADVARWAARKLGAGATARAASYGAAAGAACAAFAIAAYGLFATWSLQGSGPWRQDALSVVSYNVQTNYQAPAGAFYDGREQEFVERALEVVPEGALVVNMPFDGSAFAYGADGLDAYYRYVSGYGPESGESPQSQAIRTRLSSLSLDEEVRLAVRETGAEYLLLLDHASGEQDAQRAYPHDDGMWAGVTSVTDGTPGFQVVLAEGDMRLYRIIG